MTTCPWQEALIIAFLYFLFSSSGVSGLCQNLITQITRVRNEIAMIFLNKICVENCKPFIQNSLENLLQLQKIVVIYMPFHIYFKTASSTSSFINMQSTQDEPK